MGFNTWNLYGCSVTAQILKDTALAMNKSGLQAAGYTYVNSDDCWMNKDRDANGNQVANPTKFPDGFQNVTAYIHGFGLKSGLYTAKGPSTCAGFAASCQHEAQDALLWASWGIDYVKDDSCSNCRNDDNLDYHTMWLAIQASGREMILSIEGGPSYDNFTAGLLGNAHRVGHDITPEFNSMLSLVDIGSGLWPFAHNATTTPDNGGVFNDLDMIGEIALPVFPSSSSSFFHSSSHSSSYNFLSSLSLTYLLILILSTLFIEIGNAPDFVCGQDDEELRRCQTHFYMWCLMKSPLILGNDIPNISTATLSVLANTDAISVNQDPLGVQGKRIAVQHPKNTSLTKSLFDNIAVTKRCDASDSTQWWLYQQKNPANKPNQLFVVPCNASDLYQQWTFVGSSGSTVLKNSGSGECVDASASYDPGNTQKCDPTQESQQWSLDPVTNEVKTAKANCLDVFGGEGQGPDVCIGSCKAASDPSICNQQFAYTKDNQLQSNYTLGQTNMCLAATTGPSGGTLSTIDESGSTWCLQSTGGNEGTKNGVVCASNKNQLFDLVQSPTSSNFALIGGGASLGENEQFGASGPWPSTRYTSGFGWSGTNYNWKLDLSNPNVPTQIKSASNNHIDDNLIGTVTSSAEEWCLGLVTGGMLEVWAAPLVDAKYAVVLFNRSPAEDSIILRWSDLGVSDSLKFSIRSIWDSATLGVFSSQLSMNVSAHSTAFLILTPSS